MNDIAAAELTMSHLELEFLEKIQILQEKMEDLFGWVVGNRPLTIEEIRRMPVWVSAEEVISLLKTGTDGDLFGTDHPANLDYFDALTSDTRLNVAPGGGLTRKLINRLCDINDKEQGFITVAGAARIAGMSEGSVRNALYSGKDPQFTLTKNAAGRTVIDRRAFERWLEGRRNYRPKNAERQSINGLAVDVQTSKPTLRAVNDYFTKALNLHLHPRCKPDNKKMLGWTDDTGRLCIAHEHDRATSQQLWVRIDALKQGGSWESVPHERYAAKSSRADIHEGYGRHSGLKNYDELVLAELIKFRPRTMAEVALVLEDLGVRPQEGDQCDASNQEGRQ
jgi:hypothetical protein